MTEPQQTEQPPEQQPALPPSDPSPPEEDSALVPAILIAVATYLAWRAAHDKPPSGWQQVALAIGLRKLIGPQLAMVATRAVSHERQAAGRAGDDLLPFMQDGVNAGVEAGVRVIAEGLLWTDQHSTGVPTTQDAPATGEPAMPTATNTPALLAQMAAQAVVNGAIHAVATAAGWSRKTWRSQEDSRVRDTHRALDRTTVPMSEPFVSPSGAKLRFPGDPRAPIDEVANCRCWLRMSRR